MPSRAQQNAVGTDSPNPVGARLATGTVGGRTIPAGEIFERGVAPNCVVAVVGLSVFGSTRAVSFRVATALSRSDFFPIIGGSPSLAADAVIGGVTGGGNELAGLSAAGGNGTALAGRTEPDGSAVGGLIGKGGAAGGSGGVKSAAGNGALPSGAIAASLFDGNGFGGSEGGAGGRIDTGGEAAGPSGILIRAVSW